MFDCPRFLSSHNIEYVTRGPNTGRGRISIKCPWCREADPSQHLGISLKGSHWGCLRNSQHRGNSRSKLIQALLLCSFEEAQRLAGEETASPLPLDEDLTGLVLKNLGEVDNRVMITKSPLNMPVEFKPLRKTGLGSIFWEYLKERGYTDTQIEWLTLNYNLRHCLNGLFRYRLIIPIYDVNQNLLSWTGRTIVKEEEIRYKTLSLQTIEGYNGPLAVESSSNLLLGLPMLWRVRNANVLVLCEGPFDALRISAFGHKFGVYGTCLFGLNVSDAQVQLLEDLVESCFDTVVLLLDPDADMARLRIWDALSRQPQLKRLVCFGTLPVGVKDPGELSEDMANTLIQSWLRGV